MASDWQSCTLDQLAEIKTGKLDSNHATDRGIYPFFTCAPLPLKIDHFAFDCEAILLAGNNANGVFHLNRFGGKFNAYQRTYVITARDSTRVDIDFLFFALKTLTQRLGEYSQGTATKFLTKTLLTSLPLSLPHIHEQRSIGQILKVLNNRIESLEQTNNTLEAIAKGIFKSWFVDFDPVRAKAEEREPEGMDAATATLFPDEFQDSEFGLIPSGWSIKSVAEISASNQKAVGRDYPLSEIQYVDISSVEPGRIKSTTIYQLTDAPSRAKRLVSDGDVIWSCVRPNRRSYALVLEPFENMVVSTGFVTLTATQVPFSFLYLSVTTETFVDYLTMRADGAAYPAVRPDTFEDARLVIPSQQVANRFHEITEPLLRKCKQNSNQVDTLAELRDVLLPRLISGKLRVPEAEKMVEAVL